MTQPPKQHRVRDRGAMIRGMDPVLKPGRFHFCTTPDQEIAAAVLPAALGMFHEAEGMSMILPETVAEEHGFDLGQPMRCITLTVHSALDGVGLTAAVSAALAESDCPCNMVAAFHHDHAFVPAGRADEALASLKERAVRTESEGSQ